MGCLRFQIEYRSAPIIDDVGAIADTLQKSTLTIYKALTDLKAANLIEIKRAIGGILV